MHPETRELASHMRGFGLRCLGRAIYDATFAEITRPFAHSLAVVHAAHGAEILLKSRIAEEHPLLIFDKLPRSGCTSGVLTIAELLTHGRTLDYSEIPESLWSATGYRIADPSRFIQFGQLRNQIVHLGVPSAELAEETLKFCFEVIEPIAAEFWNESLVPYAEEWDESLCSDGYLQEQLTRLGIKLRYCLSGA